MTDKPAGNTHDQGGNLQRDTPCPDCKGRGYTEGLALTGWGARQRQVTMRYECLTCRGSGRGAPAPVGAADKT